MDLLVRIEKELNKLDDEAGLIQQEDAATLDTNENNYETVYFIRTTNYKHYAVFDTGDSLTFFEYKLEVDDVVD